MIGSMLSLLSVVVGTMLATTIVQGQTTPVASPIASPSCDTEGASWGQCMVSNNLNATACIECVAAYWTSDACSGSDDETCLGLTNCPAYCSPCDSGFIDFYNCLNSNSCDPISCSPASAPTSGGNNSPSPVAPSTPVASPIASPSCDTEGASWGQCMVSNNLNATACIECVAAYWTSDACSGSDDETCLGLTNCPAYCSPCDSGFIDFYNCLNSNSCDPISCSSQSTPTSLSPAPSPVSNSPGSGSDFSVETPTQSPMVGTPGLIRPTIVPSSNIIDQIGTFSPSMMNTNNNNEPPHPFLTSEACSGWSRSIVAVSLSMLTGLLMMKVAT